MKAVYETPHVNFEALMADNSIAAGCPGINSAGEVTFSCMVGDTTDPVKVVHSMLVNTCTTQAGYQTMEYLPAEGQKKVTFAGVVNQQPGFGHSGDTTYFDFSSTDIDNDASNEMVATFTQTALDNLIGFLYYCTNFDTSHWGAAKYGDKWYWQHDGSHDSSDDNSNNNSNNNFNDSSMEYHVQVAAVFSSNINSY